MGFQPEPTHYKLKFQNPALQGLEVTAESLSVDEFLRVSDLATAAQDTTGVEAAKSARDLLDAFAANLVSWNIEDATGAPLPAGRTALGALKFDFVLGIILAWIEATASVDTPLPGASSSGATSPEASLPMEPLSLSRAS